MAMVMAWQPKVMAAVKGMMILKINATAPLFISASCTTSIRLAASAHSTALRTCRCEKTKAGISWIFIGMLSGSID